MILPLLLALTPDASAIDVKWWGAGPQISTMLFPSAYPIALPDGAQDENGDPLVDKVHFDLELGGRAVMYPTKYGRVGARLLFGFGTSGFARQEFTLEYDATLVTQGAFQVLGGAGIGVGHEKFHGGEEGPEEGFLNVQYYPIRGELGALMRDDKRAYELALWAAIHIPGSQRYYASPDSDPVEGKGDSFAFGGFRSYVGLGLEATVFFGDFSKPNNPKTKSSDKSSKSSKSSKSKSKSKGSSGSSGGSLH